MRARGLGAVVGVVCVGSLFAGSVRAQDEKPSRVETDPVIYKSGDRVLLPIIQANIELPPSPGGWAVNTAKETQNSWDVVKRMEPGLPALTFDFTRPALGCADAAKLFDKLASVMKRHDDPAFVPATFEGWAYELPAGDDGLTTMKICTNTKQGPVMASVIYEGPASGIDPARVKPLLDAVGKAVNGHRSAGAGPSGSVATALAQMPMTGITISLPASWTARVYGETADDKTDLLERKFPASPDLFILVKRGAQCNMGQVEGHFVENPAYLPDGWGGRAVESFHPNDNTNSALFCNKTKNGDYVVGSVTYLGTLGAPDMMEVKPILASIIAQVGPATGGPSSTSDTPSSLPHDDDDDGGGRELYSLLELGIAQFNSGLADADKPLGGIVAINGFGITNDYGKTIGGAWKVSGQIGFGKDSWLPYDAQVGLGLGLQFGKIVLAPLIGVGLDGAGGSDASVAKFDAGGYWYLGGEGKISASTVGFTLGFQSLRRKADVLDRETRFTARVILKGFALGVQYTSYGTSADLPEGVSTPKAIQGTVGFHL